MCFKATLSTERELRAELQTKYEILKKEIELAKRRVQNGVSVFNAHSSSISQLTQVNVRHSASSVQTQQVSYYNLPTVSTLERSQASEESNVASPVLSVAPSSHYPQSYNVNIRTSILTTPNPQSCLDDNMASNLIRYDILNNYPIIKLK